MFTKLPALLLAATVSSFGLAQFAAAETPVSAASAKSCAAEPWLASTEGDVIVTAPRGPDTVTVLRLDSGSAKRAEANVKVRVYDANTCQPVSVNIWVQDQLGKVLDTKTTDIAVFPYSYFAEGVNYMRADRALDRDLAYLVSYTN